MRFIWHTYHYAVNAQQPTVGIFALAARRCLPPLPALKNAPVSPLPCRSSAFLPAARSAPAAMGSPGGPAAGAAPAPAAVPAARPAGTIKAMDQGTAHRICSGQVGAGSWLT